MKIISKKDPSEDEDMLQGYKLENESWEEEFDKLFWDKKSTVFEKITRDRVHAEYVAHILKEFISSLIHKTE